MRGKYAVRTKRGELLTIVLIRRPMDTWERLAEARIGNLPVAVAHTDYDKDRYWLGIAVMERFQGKGIGRALTEEILDGIGQDVWLTCPRRLAAWYQKFGFEITPDEAIKMAEGQVLMCRKPA